MLEKRCRWIDIAKGLAIIFVIVGHTVNFGSFTRNAIFSFHIPLFFLLSGYTTSLATDWSSVKVRCMKSFRHLILPTIIISVVVSIINLYGNINIGG